VVTRLQLIALPVVVSVILAGTANGTEPEAAAAGPANDRVSPDASDEAAPPSPPPARTVPHGWKEVRKGNTVYWCTRDIATGSRVRTEVQCLTPVQYKERAEEAKRATEEITRKVIPPRGG
jgi:hypothetical protein